MSHEINNSIVGNSNQGRGQRRSQKKLQGSFFVAYISLNKKNFDFQGSPFGCLQPLKCADQNIQVPKLLIFVSPTPISTIQRISAIFQLILQILPKNLLNGSM